MKQIYFGSDSRRAFQKGATLFSKAVGSTYGPKGHSVILDRMAGLLITKDGVTVAREVDLDGLEGVGARLLRESCLKTNAEAGDGTTTTAILSSAIITEGQKLITAGYDPTQLISEMKKGATKVVDFLQQQATPIQTEHDLYRVAMISSNGDEDVSKALAEACMSVGQQGTITVEDGPGLGIDLQFREGMVIDRGAIHSHMLKLATERVLEAPLVAVINGTLRTLEDVQSLLEEALKYENNPLVIFCDDLVGDALQTVLANDDQGIISVVVIPSPGFHDRKKNYLEDIAAMCGTRCIRSGAGEKWTTWDPDNFGTLKKIVVGIKKSTLYNYEEFQEYIQNRIESLQSELDHQTSEYDKDRVKERMANLSNSLCVLQVGASTEAEAKERRGRIEDALSAVQSALRNGVLPGAGTAYLKAQHVLDQTSLGEKLLFRVLESPLRQLSSNSGDSPDIICNAVRSCKSMSYGWDFTSGKVRNLFSKKTSIVDPTDVVISAFTSAMSVGTTLLTVECSICRT